MVVMGIILVTAIAVALTQTRLISALTLSFVQTDWSGGADQNANLDDNNLNGWNKFYYASTGVSYGVSGEATLKMEITAP